jgi:hypothetical protein
MLSRTGGSEITGVQGGVKADLGLGARVAA